MDRPDTAAFTIRPAVSGDEKAILSLIRELALYERLSQEVTATEEGLRKALFGPHPAAEALLAETAEGPAGFALFFHNFSTFLGKPGIYLEDIFVKPEFRGRGLGRELLRRLAAMALERGCGRIEWSVLDWNEPAIQFYKKLGARPMDEWTTFRMTREAIENLAQGSGEKR